MLIHPIPRADPAMFLGYAYRENMPRQQPCLDLLRIEFRRESVSSKLVELAYKQAGKPADYAQY